MFANKKGDRNGKPVALIYNLATIKNQRQPGIRCPTRPTTSHIRMVTTVTRRKMTPAMRKILLSIFCSLAFFDVFFELVSTNTTIFMSVDCS